MKNQFNFIKNGKLLIPVIVVLIIVSILIASSQKPYIETLPENMVEAEIITYSTDQPEEEIPESFEWAGNSFDPKYIEIPSLIIEGYIQKVGVDQNNQIAVPNNVLMAGWFVDSVLPGQKGLSIIDGHVDGLTTSGIFRNLQNIKVEDTYIIKTGEGNELKFRVKDVVTVRTEEAAEVLFSQKQGITHQLNLITCSGTYIQDQRTYDHRTIVISEYFE